MIKTIEMYSLGMRSVRFCCNDSGMVFTDIEIDCSMGRVNS